MAKLDGLETVLDFLKGLQPKIAAQIAKKVLALNVEPLPHDSNNSRVIQAFIGWIAVNIASFTAFNRMKIWLRWYWLASAMMMKSTNNSNSYSISGSIVCSKLCWLSLLWLSF